MADPRFTTDYNNLIANITNLNSWRNSWLNGKRDMKGNWLTPTLDNYNSMLGTVGYAVNQFGKYDLYKDNPEHALNEPKIKQIQDSWKNALGSFTTSNVNPFKRFQSKIAGYANNG